MGYRVDFFELNQHPPCSVSLNTTQPPPHSAGMGKNKNLPPALLEWKKHTKASPPLCRNGKTPESLPPALRGGIKGGALISILP